MSMRISMSMVMSMGMVMVMVMRFFSYPNSLDMMMMALLRSALLRLEAHHPLSILA